MLLDRNTPMREVSVIGTGMIPFGKYPTTPFAELPRPAIMQAVRDSGVNVVEIQAAYCGTLYGGQAAGQRVLAGLGMTGIPIVNVENACSSGSTAIREAYIAIGAGLYDVAIAFGVDQLSTLGGGTIPLGFPDVEVQDGVIMPAVYAMRAQRHIADHGTSLRQLAGVAVKNRGHARHNANAQFRDPITVDQVLASRPIADPLTLLQCCPTGDGAAAVVLAAADVAERYPGEPVRILAASLQSGTHTEHPRDMSVSELTVRTADQAYAGAGLGPQDLDVIELHDAFTISELMYYEALGLCQAGDAGSLLDSGATALGGRHPVNPSGGLLSKGHPVGATGAAQVVEVVNQLRGRCGHRQVNDARIGLAHATGGGVAGFDHIACTIHVLRRAG
jgi:acetyl-CoA acetyltransferase